jgi:UDPglucose 6-dehydrogenase
MHSINDKKVISVIGLGVVGLTTAVGFALKGHKVIGIDIDPEKVRMINDGTCPIYEEGLSAALKKVNLTATADHRRVLDSDITFLCGGTPPKADGSIDLFFLEAPANQLKTVLNEKQGDHLVVVRSTVVPGTTEQVIVPILNHCENVGICVNPEFLREGTAVEDFMQPSRIVIGEKEGKWGDMLADLYKDYNAPILRTDFSTAEMIKQASNAYLATRVSFINEIGNICHCLGMDVYEVAEGMGLDSRIGKDYLNAGIGFGGFCLPKDLSALISSAKDANYRARILEEVQRLNHDQPLRMLTLLKKHIPVLKGANIGVLGLAFKPGTDDVRKSKAIEIIHALQEEGARVTAHDPQAMPNFRRVFPESVKYATADEVLNADAVLILTEWDEFNKLDYRGRIVIDGRRVLKAKEARIYEGICW